MRALPCVASRRPLKEDCPPSHFQVRRGRLQRLRGKSRTDHQDGPTPPTASRGPQPGCDFPNPPALKHRVPVSHFRYSGVGRPRRPSLFAPRALRVLGWPLHPLGWTLAFSGAKWTKQPFPLPALGERLCRPCYLLPLHDAQTPGVPLPPRRLRACQEDLSPKPVCPAQSQTL